jgi:hypothetical protein
MDDKENSSDAPEVDIDAGIDRRQRWPYLVFAIVALCVVVAIARYFFLP